MKVEFTKKLIRDLQPSDKEFELHDTKQPGLFVRVRASGRHVYYCQVDRGKKAKINRTDRITLDEARDEARRVLAGEKDPVSERREAKAALEAEKHAHTLESYVMEVYAPWIEAHHGDGKATARMLKSNFFPALGSVKLADITPWHIEKWRSQRMKTKSAKTNKSPRASSLNRYVNALKAALSRAVEWGHIRENPLRPVKQLKTDSRGVVRYLTPAEEAALRAALDAREDRIRAERDSANEWRAVRGYELREDLTGDHLKPMILLSLNTGLRRGELFNLKWADIDLHQAMLTVQGAGAKSGQTRHVPLNQEAMEVLRAWRSTTSPAGLVFVGKHGKRFDNVASAFRRLLADAGIEAFRWHDIRHTFASKLVMAGVDLNTVRELLGHADIKMTLRYAHLAPHVKAAAVQKLVGA